MKGFGKHKHAGININDRSIELIIVDDASHPKRIVHSGRVALPFGAIRQGKIIQREKIIRALRSVRVQAGLAEKERIRATLSLSEDLVFPFAVSFDTTLAAKQQNQAIREEAIARIPVPEDDLAIFTLAQHPSGTTSFVYALNRKLIGVYEDVLHSTLIDVEHIEPESISIGRFLLPEQHKAKTTTVIDIGTDCTNVITYNEGYPLLSQSLPFGAEMLHKKNKLEKKTFSLARSFKPFVDELRDKIQRADDFSARYKRKNDENQIVLVGGGALLPFISEQLEKAVSRKVKIGSLGQPLDVPKQIRKELAMYTHAIGSSLREGSHVAHMKLIEIVESVENETTETPLSSFKTRTTLLIVFFILLFILLVILLVFRDKQQNSIPESSSQENVQEQQLDEKTASLHVLTISLSRTTPSIPYTIIDGTAEKTVTIETTGMQSQETNDETTKVVSQEDFTTAETSLQEIILTELEQKFLQHMPSDQLIVFAESATTFETSIAPQVGEVAETAQVTSKGNGVAIQLTLVDLYEVIEGQNISRSAIDTITATITSYDAGTQSAEVLLTIKASS